MRRWLFLLTVPIAIGLFAVQPSSAGIRANYVYVDALTNSCAPNTGCDVFFSYTLWPTNDARGGVRMIGVDAYPAFGTTHTCYEPLGMSDLYSGVVGYASGVITIDDLSLGGCDTEYLRTSAVAANGG